MSSVQVKSRKRNCDKALDQLSCRSMCIRQKYEEGKIPCLPLMAGVGRDIENNCTNIHGELCGNYTHVLQSCNDVCQKGKFEVCNYVKVQASYVRGRDSYYKPKQEYDNLGTGDPTWHVRVVKEGIASSIMIEQTEMYTWASFLANVGGILGLICGVSLMSLLQAVFHWIVVPLQERFLERHNV